MAGQYCQASEYLLNFKNFGPYFVHDYHCLKPHLGMVFNALEAEGITADSTDIYIIGDRTSSVQTVLNIDGMTY